MLFAPLLAVLASCGDGRGAEESASSAPVVLAASSLQESLSAAAEAFAAQGHEPPVLSFAATSALARQVERGAPADLFIAADEDWMDVLEEARLLAEGSRANLLANRLVIVAPRGEQTAAGDPLRGEGRIAIADPEAVPAGRYAKAALQHLGGWEEVESRVIPAENVRAALALVERGEVDRGIVYATDALASDQAVVLFRFPENSHPPIRYPAALLAASDNPEAARFLGFLRSEEARAIFRRHGFGTLE